MAEVTLYKGDCLIEMDKIADHSVDMVLCDLPYGTTACKWDNVIPFEPMWKQINRIVKDNAAIVLFGSEPFSSLLRCSNLDMYRYDWIWVKTKSGNFALARKNPLKLHENISVFYKSFPTYNLWNLHPLAKPVKSSRDNKGANLGHCVDKGDYYQTETGFHESVLYYSNPSNAGHEHPTQKPVDLLRYLIRTYTNENELVLDFTMGSGSTGVACIKEKRNFIGIEFDDKYFDIAKQRIENEDKQITLF